MRNTIGEIIDIILPFTNDINIRYVNHIPFIKASITDRSKFNKYWIYVVQLKEHQYATCESHDDVFDRYFPSGNLSNPIIPEVEIIRNIFQLNSDNDISYKYDKVINDLDTSQFLLYFLKRLNRNRIIRFNPKNLDIRISGMGITSTRIIRMIDRGFEMRNHPNGTIEDLLYIILEKKEDLPLGSLKTKEIKIIRGKLRELGIEIQVNQINNSITNVTFEKGKGV